MAEILRENPRDLLTHWFLVNRSLKQKHFKATVALLTKIQTEFGIELDDLSNLPAYSEFVQSLEYAEYLKAIRK